MTIEELADLVSNCEHIKTKVNELLFLESTSAKVGVHSHNLLFLHEQGTPLAESIRLCLCRGETPCLLGFLNDAINAGWSKEKAVGVVKDALSTNKTVFFIGENQ